MGCIKAVNSSRQCSSCTLKRKCLLIFGYQFDTIQIIREGMTSSLIQLQKWTFCPFYYFDLDGGKLLAKTQTDATLIFTKGMEHSPDEAMYS